MNPLKILKGISLIALAVTLVPGLLFFAELIDLHTVQWAALIGTIAWFLTVPFWMGRE